MDQALEILSADYWRWWLLSNCPESSDAEFTWDGFQGGVNKDLADVLGNFISRVTKFCNSKFEAAIPVGGSWGTREEALIDELESRLRAYEAHMEAMEVRKSASELRAMWAAGNEYLQDVAPWSTFKTDPDQAAAQIRLALNLIRIYAVLSAPFIPTAAARICADMNTLDMEWPTNIRTALTVLPESHGFSVPDVLFAKITDDQVADWSERFAGTRD
jgi:methionyl-tRNA synthetase